MATSPVRTVNGRTIPEAGTYVLDDSHSHVGFQAKHLMVAKVRGKFDKFKAQIVIADVPTDSSVFVTIQADSIDTGDKDRDGHLRSPDFLDVEKFPELHYVSRSVKPGDDDDEWTVEGDLTIRDVTRPVELAVTFEGGGVDPWGNAKIGFSAVTKIDREAFGLTWNQALETGGVLVGKEVRIQIDTEAALQP